ncbi:MAG: 2-oxo acid dehydrogenase subunit E2 [Candidatus Lightella neohaematopini]|nr:2-oxo acid dehydrogenase subunit E2 [Candidatus Lightella neohaematopini]MCV2531176.1 2-oxo acid dehydrogenase subunit E2 [Candidatus Lightella neohaematopini]
MNLEIRLPNVGLDKVEIIELLVNIGDYVNINQTLLTVEVGKAIVEVPSQTSGIVQDIKVKVNDKVSTDCLLMLIKTDHDITSTSNIDMTQHYHIYASPIIRRLAYKLDIDLKNIIGTGRNGRILRCDIDKFIKQKNRKINDLPEFIVQQYSKYGNVKLIKLENNKISTIKQLNNSWKNIPHVTQFDEVDITDIEEFRKNYNNKLVSQNIPIKITLLTIFTKIISVALQEFPYFNSVLINNNKLLLKKYVNIGIVVATTNGLIVPVLYNVNDKNILTISYELETLLIKIKNNKLELSNLKGGSFTISNLGVNSSTIMFTPLVNFPEVAILGLSKARIIPVWNGNNFIPKLMLPLSLSYDHRVINGLDSVNFINFIKDLVLDIRNLIT